MGGIFPLSPSFPFLTLFLSLSPQISPSFLLIIMAPPPPSPWEYLFTSSLSFRSCSHLERGSNTWVGSSLRRTFSFLLGMTGKAKVRGSWGSRRPGTPSPSSPSRGTEAQGHVHVLREHTLSLPAFLCFPQGCS